MNGVFSQTPDSVDDRYQFALTFGLNVNSNTSQVLVDNNIQRLDPNSYPSKVVRQYFDNTKPSNYQLVDIWSVHNANRYQKFTNNHYYNADSLLLWHGTKRHYLLSILQTGLQLDRTEATFGSRYNRSCIWFADRLSTSAGYTDLSGAEVVLLSKVVLHEGINHSYCVPSMSDSTQFDDNYGHKMLGNCLVPCGPVGQTRTYTVKDPVHIRIKFILHCERSPRTSNSCSLRYRMDVI